MTRNVILIFACIVGILLLACGASAVQLNYQDPADFNDLTNCTNINGVGCFWNQSAVGGNSNVQAWAAALGTTVAMYGTATPTTYAAGTINVKDSGFGFPIITLYDGSKTLQYTFNLVGPAYFVDSRNEIVVSGGTAKLYTNGILQATSTALSQNPSYVGFGTKATAPAAGALTWWDDLVYTATADPTVLDAPEFGMYYIKKDFVNPASSGLFNAANALINSNFVPMSFSRSNLTGQCLLNESIDLVYASTGTVYERQYTGTACSGQRSFDFGTSLIAANAPYGWYQWKLNNTLSERIPYIANGANIAFDRTSYSVGDPATITYLVDAAYWLPGEFTYRIEIVSANDGTVHNSQNIVTSSGSVSYTWNSDTDPQGVYFAEIIAERTSNGEDILMNYDFASVVALFGFDGFANAKSNATPISGASIVYAQGDIRSNSTSGFNGNYSSSRLFSTGVPIWCNASATGYESQNFTFTVHNGHTIDRNITLNETSPSFFGLAISGVARDGNLTGNNTIINGYGRPIALASCYVQNVTTSELYTTTTNNAGGYLFDAGSSIFLSKNRPYLLWCSKIGYSNSTIYTVVP